MTIEELRKMHADAAKAVVAMLDTVKAESRDMTDDELGKVKGLVTARDDAKVKLDAAEERATVDAEARAAVADLSKLRPRQTTATGPIVTDVRGPEERDEFAGFRRESKRPSLGMFCEDLRAVEANRAPSATFCAWRSYSEQRAAATGMVAGIGSEGGALIPDGFLAELWEKPVAENPLLGQLTRIPMTGGNTISIPYINESSRADGSRQGGIRAYRDAELEQLTESKTSVGSFSLKAEALTGFAPVSDTLLRFSALSIEPLLTKMFANAFTFTLQDELINGTGSGGSMTGILASPCLVSQAKESGQTAKTVVFTNIIKMWSRRHVGSGPYIWVVNQDAFPQLATMTMAVGTGGVPVYLPANQAAGQPYGTLMGIPMIEIEHAATVGTVGDIMLIAPSKFVLAEVPGGPEVATSIHLKFDYRQTCFRFVMYNAGAPWWPAPLTPFKGTDTKSPFVALATRA